jgi:hypothetical protein
METIQRNSSGTRIQKHFFSDMSVMLGRSCRLSDLKAHFCQDCCPLLAPETGRGDFWIKSLPHNVAW